MCKKNLLIFHMESVSNVIFKYNEECFDAIKDLHDNATYFSNYYSSATSTYMVIFDLFFQNNDAIEKSEYLEDIFSVKVDSKSLWHLLEKNKYRTYNYFLGVSEDEQEQIKNLGKMMSNHSETWIGDLWNEYEDKFTDMLESNNLFAAFIDDNASHIAYNGKRLNRDNYNGENWYKKRYETINTTLKNTIYLLKKNGKLKDTIIVVYGDHGEEYWNHGTYEGYTHAIEPFTSIISCPLVVYGIKNKNIDSKILLSTKDIFKIISYALDINTELPDNKVVYSRNLFANQVRMSDVFNKTYGVTNGEYVLMASKKGLSMYSNKMDPYNQCNLLCFFFLKKHCIKLRKKYSLFRSGHYRSYMTDKEVLYLNKQYKELLNELKKYVNSQTYLSTDICLNKINIDKKFNNNLYWVKKYIVVVLHKVKNIVKRIIK